MGLLILLEKEHFSFSPRNEPGCVSKGPLDTSTQAEICAYNANLLIRVLLAGLPDGPFLEERSEGGEGSSPSADFRACVCTQAPHRQVSRQLGELLGTPGALPLRSLPRGRASSSQICSEGGTCEASAGATRPCRWNPSSGGLDRSEGNKCLTSPLRTSVSFCLCGCSPPGRPEVCAVG